MYKRIPPRYLEKIGEKYHRITILDFFLNNNQLKMKYQCECGAIQTCRAPFHKECVKCARIRRNSHFKTHGHSRSPEYNSWGGIKSRCYNKNDKAYHNYGGRGITVCARWLGDGGFQRFLDDIGEKPEPKDNYSIERIDNNGNYTPQNCKWATRHEQLMNRRKDDGVYRMHAKVCIVCDWPFKGYFKNLYCSRGCQQKAYRQRKKAPQISKTCLFCKISFYGNSKKIYCSDKCQWTASNRRKREEDQSKHRTVSPT